MASRQTSVLTSKGDDKIEVREATPGDYDGVLAISKNIYADIDYLPDIYHTLIKDPSSNFYVLLKNGRIAAFKNFHIAYSKNHAVSMAVRVATEHQRQGLNEALHKSALQMLQQKHSTLKKVMMTSVWNKRMQSYARQHEKARVLHIGNLLVYKITSAKAALTNFLKSYSVPESADLVTKAMSRSRVEEHINQAVIDRLMPEKIFMYGNIWMPEITDEVIVMKILANEVDYVVSSFEKTTKEVVSLSYGNVGKCPFGLRYDFFYFGNSITDWVSHMTMHFRYFHDTVANIKNNNVAMMLFFPKSLRTDDVEKVLSLLGKPEESDVYPVKEYGIIEEAC